MDKVENYRLLEYNSYKVWVICYIDSNGDRWVSRNLFPTKDDANLWAKHMRDELHVCVKYRIYPLNRLLDSIENSQDIISRY